MRDKPETIAFWHGHLPHWEVANGRYFVTIHLAGAIPESGVRRIQRLVQDLERAVANGQTGLQLRRELFRQMEHWLDRSPERTELTCPAVADMVTEAIRHRCHDRTWQVYDYVIMPSHLHLFLKVLTGRLRGTLRAFKKWTGHHATGILAQSGKAFWQEEWFDHWSRSLGEDERIRRYIQQNPVKAGLVGDYREWLLGSWTDYHRRAG